VAPDEAARRKRQHRTAGDMALNGWKRGSSEARELGDEPER